MTDIEDLQTRYREAQAEADRCEDVRTSASRAGIKAMSQAIGYEQDSRNTRLFGRIPTPKSRRLERLAAEAREEQRRYEKEALEAAPAANTAHSGVRSALRELNESLEAEDPVLMDLDREQWRSAMAAQRVNEAVEHGSLDSEEAFHPDGGFNAEPYETELRKLEEDDGLWADHEEEQDGFAEAEAEAREEALAVQQLDQQIDAGTRTFEEVYHPGGGIRTELLYPEEVEREAPEPETERDEQTSETSRTAQRRDPGIEFDELF